MNKVFKEYVWEAIRAQALQDIYGYYDYRISLANRLEQIAVSVISGNYRPKAGLSLQIARPDLLARHVHIAHPDDALILQMISEAFLPYVTDKQPSKNAFYSRSHRQPKGIHKIEQEGLYPWYKLWPIYQTRILEFEAAKSFLVVTDIQSFFDSIRFKTIRRYISESYPGSQSLVDLLLAIFENFLQREIYAPVTLQGIPTLNLDAPRLVAHMLLFNVDAHLNEKTGGNFARWMDDVNFGVDSVPEARRLVRDVDSILRRIGLRLAGNKTEILSFAGAKRYLQAGQNQKLNIFETRLKQGAKATNTDLSSLIRSCMRFRKEAEYGHWDKVARRYYKVIGNTAAACSAISAKNRTLLRSLEKQSIQDYSEFTSTQFRQAILRFWGRLQPTKLRLARFCDAILEALIPDDETAFTAAEVLVDQSIPPRLRRVLISALKSHWKKEMPAGTFFASAWLVACYGSDADRAFFLSRTEGAWSGSYFLSRQAVSIWSLLKPHSGPSVGLRKKLEDLHDPEVFAQLHHFDELRSLKKIPADLRGYLPLNVKLKHLDSRRAIMIRNILYSPDLDAADRAALTSGTLRLAKTPLVRSLALDS